VIVREGDLFISNLNEHSVLTALKESSKTHKIFQIIFHNLLLSFPSSQRGKFICVKCTFVNFQLHFRLIATLLQENRKLLVIEDNVNVLVLLHIFGHAVKDVFEEISFHGCLQSEILPLHFSILSYNYKIKRLIINNILNIKLVTFQRICIYKLIFNYKT
jgi:hypothetical protein